MRHKSAIVIKHGYRWSARLVLVSLILGGLLLGLARLFLPIIVDYRQDIEALAQEVLQSPVTIGQIETSWDGLRPVVTLRDIDIEGLSERANSIHLQSLDIAISPLSSLFAGDLRPSHIVLKMHELEVRRLADGSLNFSLGYEDQPEHDLLDKETMNWLLDQPDLHLEIQRVGFEDHTNALPQMTFSDIGIVFIKEDTDVVVSIDTAVTNLARNVRAIVRLQDIIESEGTPPAQIYIQLGGVSLDAVRGIAGGRYGLPDSGQVDLELWVNFKQGKLEKVQGNWLSSDIFFAAQGEIPAVSLDSLKTGFIWEKKPQGWRLELSELQLSRSDYQWPETTLSVDLQLQDESRRYLINTNYLRLDDILPIIWQQPAIPEAIKKRLIKMSPRGQLSNLKMQLSYEEGAVSQYGVQMDIADLSLNADGEFPGVKGLDGYLAATEKAGLFRMATLDAEVYLPTVFRKPLPLDRMKGTVNWSRLDDGLLIESADLVVENAHLKTQSRLSVHLPDKGAPFVDLQTNFRDGDATYTSLYLPVNVLNEGTLQWLDKGIVSGHVEYGTFVLYGALDDFPYDHKNGKFEVRFKVRDAIVDYYNDWPVIDEIEAEVVFSGRSMHIEATTGKIFEADILSTIVEIADMDSDNPLLTIRGKLRSSSKDLMRYLTETSLAGDYQKALSFMTLKGSHHLNLNLNIPLSEGNVRFDGNLAFLENQLEIPSWQVSLKAIQGQLDFTENLFEANDIKADFEGYPANIDVSTQHVPNGRETHIQASSLADLSKLLAHGGEGLSGLIEGKSPVRVEIIVPDYPGGASRLVASSTLMGIAINLPAPLGKDITSELPLIVATGFEGEAARRIDIEMGEQIQAVLLIGEKESGLDGIALHFGEISPDDLYERARGRAYIGGQLASLSVNEWVDWYGALPAQGETLETFPISADIRVDQLSYARWFMKDVAVMTQQSDEGWVIDLSGTGAQGRIVVPQDNSLKLEARLSKLSLYKQETEAAETSVADQPTNLMPDDIPSVSLQIDQLYYQSRELGGLHAEIKSQHNLLDIDEVVLKNPQTETRLTGNWLYDQDGNQHKTTLELTQSSKDFGNFLTRHGFEDTVQGGESEIKANITADTPLPDISSKELSGKVRFDLDEGEIVEIDPGGAGRIFGLLSFQSLPRRLILDFKDLFSKGMSFDEIDGNFTLSNGQAYTNNLIMEAPSSRVEISGRVGLAEEDYDQLVRVIPKISSTLPLVGALAGGPGLAVVMYLTHKLFKDPINKITEIEYQITGPWRDPTVTRLDDKDKTIASKESLDKTETDIVQPDSLE